MSSSLIESLQRLHEFLPKAEPTLHEMLDILWLGARLPRPQEAIRPEQVSQEDPAGEEEVRSATREKSAEPPPKSPAKSRPPMPSPSSEGLTTTSVAGVYTAVERRVEERKALGATPLLVPGTPGLTDALRIGRALRPLMRRVPSRHALILDETATAEESAEARTFTEVKRPASASWLDLGIVVDRSGAMEIWARTVVELRDLLERHRAFRNVRAWDMVEESGALVLRTWSKQPRTINAAELSDPTGTQLIAVISDCVSRAWSSEQMPELLRTWNEHGPVAIFQVMPQNLWRRTALRHAQPTFVCATAPGVSNRYARDLFEKETRAGGDEGPTVTVPVTSIDAAGLAEWANFVAATGGGTARAYVFRTSISSEERSARDERAARAKAASAAERVSRFDLIATPDGKRLARVLAAAPFPLTPPVLRLVQDEVLPGTSRSAAAEVVLGGLLRSTPGEDPERTEYGFVSKEVVDLLLDRASASDLARLMQTELSKFIGDHRGDVIDFGALIRNPAAIDSLTISPNEVPFAEIGVNTLKRIGGQYAALADRIEKVMRPAAAAVADRTDGSLRSYLENTREAATPEELVEWILELRKFGLRVALLAMLLAVEQTKSGRRAAATLMKARECVETGASSLAISLAESAGLTRGVPPRDRDAPTMAVYATTVAFDGDARSGPATVAAIREAARAVTNERRDCAAVVDAVRKRLLADVLSGQLRVRGELPYRGRVIVAGTVKRIDLPPDAQRAGRQMGQKLAAAGFELAVGGYPGVDYLVASAFVRELEINGGDVESRIVQHVEEGQSPDYADVPLQTAVSYANAVIDGAKALVVIGPCDVERVETLAVQRQIPILPLLWTEAATKEKGPRGGRFLDDPFVESDADSQLLTNRALAAVATLSDDDARERWREYTHLIHSIVGAERTAAAFSLRAPRFARFLEAIAADRPPTAAMTPDVAFERLREVAGEMAEWLVYDLLTLSEAEADSFYERDYLVHRLAEVAAGSARPQLEAWLEHHWAEVGRLLPRRPIDGLMPIARALFPDEEALSEWTVRVAGITPAECVFRMAIPFAVYSTAVAYAASNTDETERRFDDTILYGLQRRVVPYDFVSKYADAPAAAARLIGYVLMQMNDYDVAAVELAHRIEQEVLHTYADDDARPMKQLLLAVSKTAERYDAPARRVIARALASARRSLAASSAIEARFCRELLASLLKMNLFRDARAANETIDAYTQTFATEQSSITPLPPELQQIGLRGDEVEYLFRTGRAEQRLAALKFAAAAGDASSFEVVHLALSEPRSAIEFRFAIYAADMLAPRLKTAQLVALSDLLQADPPPFDGGSFARTVAARLRSRIEAVDRVRYAPVAVLGSDPAGERLREFCRELGARLAARELGVIVANPDLAQWLAEGYRLFNADLHGFVMLRRSSDRRPVRQGVPWRTIDTDLSELRGVLLEQARGVIVIGGRKGTYEEYTIAHRRGIPVVTAKPSGHAAAGLSQASVLRLRKSGLPDDLLFALENAPLSADLAAAVADAMAWAIADQERRQQDESEHERRAATVDEETLAKEVRVRIRQTDHDHVDEALVLLNAAISPSAWTGEESSLIRARRFAKRVQRLQYSYTGDPYVTALIARSSFALFILEAAAVARTDEDMAAVEAAAQHRSFTEVRTDVLEHLRQLLGARGAAASQHDGRRNALLALLDEEIETRRP